MNLYIVVEGKRTETAVYPAWLKLLAPAYTRISDAWDVRENNYYLFSSEGQPIIYDHICNAIEDVNNINAESAKGYDYLVVCIDTEELAKGEQTDAIKDNIKKKSLSLNNAKLVVLEQQVCIETWFLGNKKIFKKNPNDSMLANFIKFYNVFDNNPEMMGNIDPDRYSTKAQFHHAYLQKMFRERNMTYSKNNTREVQTKDYLQQLISRYEKNTDDIATFGAWYEFMKGL